MRFGGDRAKQLKQRKANIERIEINNMGRSPSCDENGLKKGPWTPEEDQKLVHYIKQHGHGSWRALPRFAGSNFNPN